MRFLSGLVAAGAASLAAASASASASASAAIYEFTTRRSASHDAPLEVSPGDARLALAQRLGVAKFYELGVQGPNDRRIEVLGRLAGSPHGLLGDAEADAGRVVLSVAGLEDPAAFVAGSAPDLEQSMTLTGSVGSAAASALLKDLAAHKGEATGQSPTQIDFGHSFCMLSSSSTADKMIDGLIDGTYAYSRSKTTSILSSELLSTFPPGDDDHTIFVSTYIVLSHLVKQVAAGSFSDPSTYAFCHFQGLEQIISAYGSDSRQASIATDLYRSAVSRLTSSDTLQTTLLLTPPSSPSADADVFSSADVHKRAKRSVTETPLSMKQEVTVEAPVPTTPSPARKLSAKHCAATEDSCNNSTDSCSGHGACAETSKGCWSCVCKPSIKYVGESPKTTYWAGAACQKKDVSVPFNLLFLFTVGIVLVVGWAIGLLYSIGDMPLPSVLAAGVAPPKRS